jgi:soluble lytic murein transglycosylase-like protein
MHIMKAYFLVHFVLGVLVILLWQSPIFAAIYSCADKNGNIHFTNTPVSQSCEAMDLKRNHKQRYYSPKNSKNHRYNSNSYDRYIKTIARRYRMDPHLIKAVIKTESGFNRYAVSKRGAQGLMQLMPATARELRVRDPFDPRQNIDGGTRYLRKMMDIFGGNLGLALAAYNAGPNRVQKNNKIPRIPETIVYVRKVLKQYRKYKAYKALSS